MENKKVDVGYIAKIVVIIFCLFLFGKVIPTWGPVTQIGVSVIGVLIGVIFMLQVGFDLGAGAVLGIFALLLSGYYKSGDLIKAGMGNNSVFQLMMLFTLCGVLQSSGAAEVIARKIVTSKIANGRPAVLLFLFFLASAVSGATVGQSGSIVLLFATADSLIDMMGFDRKSRFVKTFILCIYLSTGFGSAALPFKGLGFTLFALLNVGFTAAGIEVDFGAYMLSGIPFVAVFMLIMTIIICVLFKSDVKKLKDLDVATLSTESLKMNTKQRIYSFTFVLIFIFSFLTALLPKTNGLYKILNGWGLGFFGLLLIGILCLIRLDGKPLFVVQRDFKNGMKWNQIFAIFLFTTLGTALSADDVGIKTWLIDTLDPIFGGMSYLPFMFVIMLITVVFTNFFANNAVGTIIATVISPFIVMFAQDLGINSSVVVALIVQSAVFAYWTPAASAMAPMLFDHPSIASDRKFIWTDGMLYSALFAVIATLWFAGTSFLI